MKTPAVFLLALGLAVTAAAETPMAAPPATKAPAPKDAKEEAPAKIEGMEVARGEGRFMGVLVLDGKFKLNFYDAKKKPVAPDAGRAVLRWDPKYKLGIERVVLTPGGGPNSLTNDKFIRPPYNFKLTIVLLGDAATGDDVAGETFVIDFRQ